jgi:hypothetical protein
MKTYRYYEKFGERVCVFGKYRRCRLKLYGNHALGEFSPKQRSDAARARQHSHARFTATPGLLSPSR